MTLISHGIINVPYLLLDINSDQQQGQQKEKKKSKEEMQNYLIQHLLFDKEIETKSKENKEQAAKNRKFEEAARARELAAEQVKLRKKIRLAVSSLKLLEVELWQLDKGDSYAPYFQTKKSS